MAHKATHPIRHGSYDCDQHPYQVAAQAQTTQM